MRLTFVLALLTTTFQLTAQQTKSDPDPLIGRPFPVYTFKEIQNGHSKSFRTTDAKGKWLILDFWDESCAACINSFPELEKIQNRFNDKIKLLSVGYTGAMRPGYSSNKSIRQLWNRINAKYNFGFTIAFDSVLFNKFEIGGVGCPYVIIIDPSGVVKAISSGLKEKYIERILADDFSLLPLVQRSVYEGDWAIDSTEILLRSLSVWKKGVSSIIDYLSDTTLTNKFQIIGVGLGSLYRYALTGNANWDSPDDSLYSLFRYFPILEINDSSLFDKEKKFSFNLKTADKKSKSEIMWVLKSSLSEAFGYNMRVETRMSPYWKITLVDSFKTRLISKGGPSSYETKGKFTGFKSHNYPVSNLINHLWAHFQLHNDGGIGRPFGRGRPFIDETGLTENIDITVDAFMEDFNEVRAALLKKGIKIEEAWKPMKCIVISDPKPENK